MANRLKGQEVSIRVIVGGVTVDSVTAISSFNDGVATEIKEAGFLGEPTNRFDDVLNGYGGDLDFQCEAAAWHMLVTAIEDRATRRTPDTLFNVIRTDQYPNGDTALYTYEDVKWGPIPTNVPARGDFVKVKLEFKCSTRTVRLNSLP